MRPRIGLVVITDGRVDYLERCLASLRVNLKLPSRSPRFVVLDEPDALDATTQLAKPDYAVVAHGHRFGAAEARRTAWHAAREANVDFLFHVEDDFVFNGPVPISRMVDVLESQPNLAQIVLKRQAWSDAEVAAGGLVEKNPRLYVDVRVLAYYTIAVHKRGFSSNPCLIPRRVFERPYVECLEPVITEELLAARYHFALWGSQYDPPRVTHIGGRRAPGATGYPR